MASTDALYGFGVIADEARVVVDDPSVFAIHHDGLAALVTPVSRDDFEKKETLESVEWLSGQIARHNAILTQAMRETTVVPWRFGALFANKEGVQHVLADRRDQFRSLLATLADREEWTVEGLCDNEAALLEQVRSTVPAVRDMIRTERAAGAGVAYLLARKREQIEREEIQSQLRARAEESGAHLREIAKIQPLEPLEGRFSRVAALIDVANRKPLAQMMAQLSGRGVLWSLRGPYPPYSFVGELGCNQ